MHIVLFALDSSIPTVVNWLSCCILRRYLKVKRDYAAIVCRLLFTKMATTESLAVLSRMGLIQKTRRARK